MQRFGLAIVSNESIEEVGVFEATSAIHFLYDFHTNHTIA